MTLHTVFSALILGASLVSLSAAASEPAYKIQVPVHGLAVSSTATPSPSPPPPPQQYSFNPASGEVFTIPAGATAIRYDVSFQAYKGWVTYALYRGDTYVTGGSCGCSSTANTFLENQLVPGYSYRLVVSEGTLSPDSVLKYTR